MKGQVVMRIIIFSIQLEENPEYLSDSFLVISQLLSQLYRQEGETKAG